MIGLMALIGARGDAQQAQQQPQAQPPAQTQPSPQTPTDQPPPVPQFRTGINFVRVDAIITDKNGNSVPDLQAADFDVLEDGKPQKIETFRLVKLDGGPMEKEPQRESRTDYDE